MREDPGDEIAALAADIREHLTFFRDIGATDIGGSMRPPLAFGPSESASADSIPTADTETRAITLSNRANQVVDPESQTQVGPSLEQAPGNAPQFNLFGEVVQEAYNRNVTVIKASPETNSPSEISRDGSLDEIRSDIGECTRCHLHEQRTNIVFGEGNPAADLVFVGEGPGAEEDRTGRPFVGKAGKLLDKIIEAIGMRRSDVYIANVVKCRPPDNRTPERDEAATCGPFLFRQLGFIRPKVIVALGAPALQCLTGSREGITKVRGHWQEWNGIRVMPTYHPAYLLRVPDKKKETWEDMKRVRDYIVNGGVYPGERE